MPRKKKGDREGRPCYAGRVKVWHAVLIGLGLVVYVRPVALKRALLLLLIFFSVTGCR